MTLLAVRRVVQPRAGQLRQLVERVGSGPIEEARIRHRRALRRQAAPLYFFFLGGCLDRQRRLPAGAAVGVTGGGARS